LGKIQVEGVYAISEAMGAGLLVEFLPAALLAAYHSVENFKSAAEHYCQAIDIQKEARNLLEMERSLERDRERSGGRER
jgi:hypothetical protein